MKQDQQRIEFAERLGWERQQLPDCLEKADESTKLKWTVWKHNSSGECFELRYLPNPTSREDVHNALMGMSEVEWKKFVRQFLTSFAWHENYSYDLVKSCFCAPLSTLVECFLEATKGRVE